MRDDHFVLETENGWLAGFRNMFANENVQWWRTGKWLTHLIVWFILLDVLIIANLYILPVVFSQEPRINSTEKIVQQATGMFFTLAGLYLPAGIVILVHDSIIRERELGTMAWIMSKPVSRPSFVLSKMAANVIAIMIIMVVVPGIVAYGVLSLYTGGLINATGFAVGLGIMALLCLFYLCMTFLMGTITQSRYAVIGFGVIYLFLGLTAAGLLPDIAPYFVWDLSGLARDIAIGNSLPSDYLIQVIAALAWAVIMAAIAIRQIQQVEI